jgi:hypothetical protein
VLVRSLSSLSVLLALGSRQPVVAQVEFRPRDLSSIFFEEPGTILFLERGVMDWVE